MVISDLWVIYHYNLEILIGTGIGDSSVWPILRSGPRYMHLVDKFVRRSCFQGSWKISQSRAKSINNIQGAVLSSRLYYHELLQPQRTIEIGPDLGRLLQTCGNIFLKPRRAITLVTVSAESSWSSSNK